MSQHLMITPSLSGLLVRDVQRESEGEEGHVFQTKEPFAHYRPSSSVQGGPALHRPTTVGLLQFGMFFHPA